MQKPAPSECKAIEKFAKMNGAANCPRGDYHGLAFSKK